MRRRRLFTIFLPACLLLGGVSVGSTWLTACGNSTSSGSGGDCFDYSSIDLTTPAVSFKTDVLPIFRQSCGLSTSCHGSPTGGSLGGQHFYGPSNSAPAPSAADIQAIMDQSVGKASTANPDMVVIKSPYWPSFLRQILQSVFCSAFPVPFPPCLQHLLLF